MSLLGQFLRIHEAIYKRSDGRIGHRMLEGPIRPSSFRSAGSANQARPG